MDPKFIKLEEAAELLKVSTERLNTLREEGKLRAYRDGSSWKFRTEEIEKMAAEGVPTPGADESGIDLDDLSLGGGLQLGDEDQSESKAEQLANGATEQAADDTDKAAEGDNADSSESDLQLADDDLDLATGSSAELAIDLDDEEDPTPEAEQTKKRSASDESAGDTQQSAAAEQPSESAEDDPESILLSEAELGDSPDRPPSTIIGKAELDDASDLELAPTPPAEEKPGSDPDMSDVRLADLEDLESGSSATGELPASEGTSGGDFDDIEELEIDLEAESSRILSPDDVAAAQEAGSKEKQKKDAEKSDLDLDTEEDYGLAPSSDAGRTSVSSSGHISDDDDDDDLISGSEIDLGDASSAGSGSGLTGLSALELDESEEDADDDFVLGDGSDLTLSAADSGINLSPADSGLSLDDAAVDLTGSAIGSGIDFGEASGLVSDEPAGGDFELTPLAEEAGSEEDDDSSQVIALDAFEEQPEADQLLEGGGAPTAAGMGQSAAVARVDVQFPAWVIGLMGLGLLMLGLCGIMLVDVIRSMWSWDQPFQINSTIIDSLTGFFFP